MTCLCTLFAQDSLGTHQCGPDPDGNMAAALCFGKIESIE